MWLSFLALFVSILSLTCCVWLFLELSKKLSTEDLKSKLSLSSEELSKSYARSVKELETEWDNMYEKFGKLAGRMDRKRQLEAPPIVQTGQQEARPMKRSDLLRGRNK
jgi:hypothetical protein